MSAFQLLDHRLQQKLWEMKWTELHPVQVKAIERICGAGGDCVISSPTASGKTEAAFLPVLSKIANEPLGSVRAVYVGPLKALINDQFQRLEDLCARLDVPVHKWHGDVDTGARQRLARAPGGVLLITPESLEAMFVLRSPRLPHIFSKLAYVVIDELHSFLENERGAQLRSLLYRLRLRAGCDPIRVGLSATLAEPERALAWIRPDGPPALLIADASARSSIAIRARGIWRPPDRGEAFRPDPAEGEVAPDDDDGAEEDHADPSVTELARNILVASHGKTNLVFANAKAHIEVVADELATQAAAMNLPDEIVVHHGSLSKAQRDYAETRLRDARPCTAVCSNTLEMGIDIGSIDEIVQIDAPWTVASLVQRLGRSGRRGDKRRVLRAYFTETAPSATTDFWDGLHLSFLQGLAVIELMLEGFLEPPETDRAHFSTLVQQALSIVAETGGIKAMPLFERLMGSRAFGELSRAEFAGLLRELGRHRLLEQAEDATLVLGEVGERIVEHYSFYAAFATDPELKVIAGGEEIGVVHAPTPVGEHLILAGRRWCVDAIDLDRKELLVSRAKGRKKPWFNPSVGTIHPAVHAKMKELALGTSVPAYLDETASEMLANARVTAAQLEGFEPAIQVVGGRTRLFVWGGSKRQLTLSMVLGLAGIQHENRSVGFDVDADRTKVREVLERFEHEPNQEALGRYADERLMLREMGREKYGKFLPKGLWRRDFIARHWTRAPSQR